MQRIGLLGGPFGALVLVWLLPDRFPGPDGGEIAFTEAGRATAGLAFWMAAWWLSEAISIYATALLPLVVLPLVGATTMRAAAAPYAHELIFLFMGGFLLALGMQRWGLHRRIALAALGLAGDRPGRIVAAFMLVTAALSMWVSNTATAVMMLPVALSVVDRVTASQSETDARNFGLCLLLGIAYGASIGGLATPIGTPPNLFLLSFAKEHLGIEVSFVRWMGVALPLVVVFLPATWLVLTRIYPPGAGPIDGGIASARRELRELGPLGRGERLAGAVFGLASLLWLTRPLLTGLEIAGRSPFAGLTDSGIAMLAAVSLFVLPASRDTSVLDWDTARSLPFGILLLFGGGLSLAGAIRVNGVAELLGAQTSGLAGLPALGIVVVVVTGVIFLTELTSNTATTATLIPILAALAPGLGVPPMLLAVPAALAATCAFMLPVATPPNAVVFGSGRIRIPEMSRAGLAVNAIGIVLIPLATWLVAMPMLRAAGSGG